MLWLKAWWRDSPKRSPALPSEPDWLSLDEIVWINRLVVEAAGEPFALLNPGLLESAWAKPINRWNYEGERDLAVLAATLLFGIARNHPFEQGNKRTGFLAATSFLSINHCTFVREDSETLAEEIIAVIEGRVDERSFTAEFARFVVALL